MAYEVLKTIGNKRYRYRVQSERDAQTGKTRNRWTYLGRVDGDAADARVLPPRGNARTRLLDAAATLLAAGDPRAITADAIARTAGLAHGTFYRHFRDRSEALEALARELSATRGLAEETLLDAAVASPAIARANVRAWVAERLTKAREFSPSYRAWFALSESDARLAAFGQERRAALQERLCAYITAIGERGFARVDDPAATAFGVLVLVDGTIRAAVFESAELDDTRTAAVIEIVERALFA